MKRIIYVGLSDTEAKLLSWDNNTDNEYRISMAFIERVRCIHNEFEEKCVGDNTKVSLEFWKECCMEISYQIKEKINSKGGKVHYDLFKGIDNIFQFEFRTREIWKFINEIFSIWENICIKN